MCIRDSPETALPLQPPSAYEANRDIVFMTLPLLALSTYFYGARPAVLDVYKRQMCSLSLG